MILCMSVHFDSDNSWNKFKNKNSDKLELNQRPKDNRETLQSLALPTELLSESNYPYYSFHKLNTITHKYFFLSFLPSPPTLVIFKNYKIYTEYIILSSSLFLRTVSISSRELLHVQTPSNLKISICTLFDLFLLKFTRNR